MSSYVSDKEREKLTKRVRAVRMKPVNKTCFVCGDKGPNNVCLLKIPTFLCMMCAGIHRNYGLRICSISTTNFTKNQVELIETSGNDVAKTFYCAVDPNITIPGKDEPKRIRESKVQDFIKSVIVNEEYTAENNQKQEKKSKKNRKAAKAAKQEADLPPVRNLQTVLANPPALVVEKKAGKKKKKRRHRTASNAEAVETPTQPNESWDGFDAMFESQSGPQTATMGDSAPTADAPAAAAAFDDWADFGGFKNALPDQSTPQKPVKSSDNFMSPGMFATSTPAQQQQQQQNNGDMANFFGDSQPTPQPQSEQSWGFDSGFDSPAKQPASNVSNDETWDPFQQATQPVSVVASSVAPAPQSVSTPVVTENPFAVTTPVKQEPVKPAVDIFGDLRGDSATTDQPVLSLPSTQSAPMQTQSPQQMMPQQQLQQQFQPQNPQMMQQQRSPQMIQQPNPNMMAMNPAMMMQQQNPLMQAQAMLQSGKMTPEQYTQYMAQMQEMMRKQMQQQQLMMQRMMAQQKQMQQQGGQMPQQGMQQGMMMNNGMMNFGQQQPQQQMQQQHPFNGNSMMMQQTPQQQPNQQQQQAKPATTAFDDLFG